MRVRTPDYYRNFKCIDKKCTDTCCAGWEVDLDEDSCRYYRSVDGAFGERLKRVMVFEEGENRFKLRENGRCPFLNDENLCDLYIALGEDKLCKTCAEHPRYKNDFGDLREKGISISCPEAARIILSKKTAVTYETVVTEEAVPEFSNLDPQKYMTLVMARKEAYSIAADQNMPVFSRVGKILEKSVDYQQQLTKKSVNKKAGEIFCKKDAVLQFLKYIKDYECINPDWDVFLKNTMEFLEDESKDYEKIHREFEEKNSGKMYQYEQIAMYFLYRYYISSIYDYDLLSKVKLMAFALLVCEEMAVALWVEKHNFTLEDQIEIVHCFSRQFEHSDVNVEDINRSFRTKELFDIKQFIEIL